MPLQLGGLRLIAAAVAPVVLAATAPNSEIRVVPYRHFFAIRLETNKQTYRASEPINVRIAITNVTDQPHSIVEWQPVALVPLLVRDSRGVQISPTVPGHGQRMNILTPTYHLAPKATVTIGWMEISKFGYALTQPGTYTVTASLHGVGRTTTTQGTETFGMSGEDKSNAVTIQILP
jgi:hypothetical protein